MAIDNYKTFHGTLEEKIYNFSDFVPTKYNSNIIITQIMEWLRAKILNNDNVEIKMKLDDFFRECSVDKNKFMTFYDGLLKSENDKNFKMKIVDDVIIFFDFVKSKKN